MSARRGRAAWLVAAVAGAPSLLAVPAVPDSTDRMALDFSGPSGRVGVDPVVQVLAGTAGAETWWDNCRGARFEAELDGVWAFSGELLERQGVGDPRLEPWLAQGVLPAWGRPKRTDDQGFDLARATAAATYRRGGFQAEVGYGAPHVGPGMRSVLLSRDAAPAPYARAAHGGARGYGAVSALQWTAADRLGPGSTAEPPYRWARTGVAEAGLARDRFAATALVAATQSGLPDRAAPLRAWGGLTAEVRGGGPAARWTAYLVTAVGSDGARRPTGYGTLIGVRAAGPRWRTAAEVHIDRAARAGLDHAGLPVGLLRPAATDGTGALAVVAVTPVPRLRLEAAGSWYPELRHAVVEAGWSFRKPWRWEAVAGAGWADGWAFHVGTVAGVDRAAWGLGCGKPARRWDEIPGGRP